MGYDYLSEEIIKIIICDQLVEDENMMIDLEEFEEAYQRVKPHLDPSPLRYSHWLSEVVKGDVYLKLECLNPGRSFKIRGATNTLLSQEELPQQVITASGGNHGLGVAIACQRLDLPCKVILPTSTSSYRVALLEQLGAEVALQGEAWDEANKVALREAEQEGTLYIHPFADRPVIIGQGTIMMEIDQRQALDQIDNFVASVGGGGLLAGNALALEAMNYPTNIIAVETKGADSLATSLHAGELQTLPAITSIAKTLGAKTTTPFIFETMTRLVDDMFVISDRDAVKTMFEFLDQEKLLVEPATSCSVSAMLQHPDRFQDQTTVIVICGSNVTYKEALQWKEEFNVEF